MHGLPLLLTMIVPSAVALRGHGRNLRFNNGSTASAGLGRMNTASQSNSLVDQPTSA